jgi:hypothetical protein
MDLMAVAEIVKREIWLDSEFRCALNFCHLTIGFGHATALNREFGLVRMLPGMKQPLGNLGNLTEERFSDVLNGWGSAKSPSRWQRDLQCEKIGSGLAVAGVSKKVTWRALAQETVNTPIGNGHEWKWLRILPISSPESYCQAKMTKMGLCRHGL